ncbi:hypothetical protein ES708_00056 [subsurface metagenome]
MKKSEIEATQKLGEGMAKLATALEKFQDPVLWQKLLGDAITRGSLGLPVIIPQALGPGETAAAEGEALRPVGIESVAITLSDEERAKIAGQVYEAVQPQLAEFNVFVQQALAEMPADRLKRIADKIEAGEKVTIKRRQGCVFIAAGDVESYLGL